MIALALLAVCGCGEMDPIEPTLEGLIYDWQERESACEGYPAENTADMESVYNFQFLKAASDSARVVTPEYDFADSIPTSCELFDTRIGDCTSAAVFAYSILRQDYGFPDSKLWIVTIRPGNGRLHDVLYVYTPDGLYVVDDGLYTFDEWTEKYPSIHVKVMWNLYKIK